MTDYEAHAKKLRQIAAQLCFEHLAWQESGYAESGWSEGGYRTLRQLNKTDLRHVVAMLVGSAVRAGVCDREMSAYRPTEGRP